jgi:hypothetical protein
MSRLMETDTPRYPECRCRRNLTGSIIGAMAREEPSTTGTRMTVRSKKRTKDLRNPATSAPKPGDYSLGGLKSRAAARAMAEAQKEDEGITVIHQAVYVSPDGTKVDGDRIIVPARSHRRPHFTAEPRRWIRPFGAPLPYCRIAFSIFRASDMIPSLLKVVEHCRGWL